MAIFFFLVATFAINCIFTDTAWSKDDGTPELIRFLRDGQIKKVDDLLKKNADVNIKDEYGWTPLMYAVFRSDGETVDKLLLRGADINAQDRDGVTPLIAAILLAPPPFMLAYMPPDGRLGRDVAIFLIAKGADPNRPDNDGNTPLIYAVNREQGLIAEALIKKGADINHANGHGFTPLYLAENSDKAREWAPASGALSSSIRARGIPADESHFSRDYAAAVARARQQAEIQRRGDREKLVALLRSAGATTPDPATIRASGNSRNDSGPRRKDQGKMGSLEQTMMNYARMSQKSSGYRLLVRIAPDGTVKQALVLAGAPDGISEKLQKAAFKLKYEPAIKNGQPVEDWDTISGGGVYREFRLR